jgi:hypothetical protein
MTSKPDITNDAQQQTAITIDPSTYEEPTLIVHSTTTIPNFAEDIKLIIYSRSHLVKWLAIIDMVFLTISVILNAINGAIFWVLFPLILFCFCGYKGAKTYQKNLIMIYEFYLFGMTIFYFLMALYSNNFFWFLFLFIEFYFFYYTSRLIHYLNSVDQDIIESLRSGWNPNEITYFYY